MQIDPAMEKVTPLEAARRMSSPTSPMADDARYWAEQMRGVAERQDVDCFMRIYDYYAPRLLRYLLGLKLAAPQAEELVQEAMLRLWRRAELFNPSRACLSTWLFRVARNLYIDGQRGEPHGLFIQDELHALDMETNNSGLSTTEAFADHVRLAHAINALSAVQARLIRMSYLEAKSHGEIALELAMPLGTVKSHIRRAFAKLQANLRAAP